MNTGSNEVNFSKFLALLKRRWLTICILVILGVSAGAIISSITPPRYASVTQMLVEQAGQNAGGPEFIAPELTTPSATYRIGTLVQLMQTSEVYLAALQAGGVTIPARLTQEALDELPRLEVVGRADSQVITVAVNSGNPEVAERVAAALPNVFAIQVRQRERDAIERATAYVRSRIEEERGNLAEAEQRLVAVRTETGTADSGTELSARTQNELAAERLVDDAETALQAAIATLNQHRAFYQTIPATRTLPSEETNLEQLRNETRILESLLAERDALLVRYTESHPSVRNINARIERQQEFVASLEQTTQREVTVRNPLLDSQEQRIIEAEAGVAAAREQLAAARRILADRQRVSQEILPIAVQQLDAERAVGEISQTIARLNTTLDNLSLRQNEIRNPIQTVTPARPANQTQPNLRNNLLVGFIIGLILGIAAAIARDYSLDKVYAVEDAASIVGKPVLSIIPLRSRAAHPLIADPGKMKAFESYRVLRTNLGPYVDSSRSSIVVTSTEQGEGKTTVSANLAQAYAQTGARVLLIDADLRKPSVAKLFNLKADKGLVDFVEGDQSLQSVVQATHVNNLSVLTAGSDTQTPTEILQKPRFRELLTQAETEYDIVIVDTIGAVGYADAQVLGGEAACLLYVTHLQKPKKSEYVGAVQMLEQTGSTVAGIVVNKYPSKELL